MHVFVIGAPHDMGGAGLDSWYAVKLWRSHNIDVTFIVTSDISQFWKERLKSIGCSINYLIAGNQVHRIREIDGLPGSIVLSFCDGGFLRISQYLKILGCKIVWLGLTSWLHKMEQDHYKTWGPYSRYVFQSRYQQYIISAQLRTYGYTERQLIHIPSPIDIAEYLFQPLAHLIDDQFVVGRVSRADQSKFTKNLWEIYRSIGKRVRARVMGWDNTIAEMCGPTPRWAECLSHCAMNVQDFMHSLHCMIQIGQVKENRPRTCLEAMAYGVPVIAPADSGWKELIRHGHNGFLCNDPGEVSYYATLLANNENLRLDVIHTARRLLLSEIANPVEIWSLWQNLFNELNDE